MESIFLNLLNMSISAGWVVAAVLVLRLFMRRVPRWVHCLLWAMVGVRLIFPFSIESILSLIPSAVTVPEEILYMQEPVIESGVEIINAVINPVIADSFTPQAGASVNPLQVWMWIAGWVWVIGLVGMGLYTLLSTLRISRRLREAVEIEKGVCLCERIDTPFILGLFRPCIYLPSSMDENDREYVLAHERAHLKRHDHWWKPLGFALLAIHWFNPMLWLAYWLLSQDIELACDEKVIGELGAGSKKAYSTALINCSVPRRMLAACPLAFGEVGVKQRVKAVLHYKKPAFWVILAAVGVCMIAGVCLLTDPVEKTYSTVTEWFDYSQDYWQEEISQQEWTEDKNGSVLRCTADAMSLITETGTVTLYEGMPIWNAYFADLNGDGTREVCSAVSMGSGIIDNRIMVYDLSAGQCYELEDRGQYDYYLIMNNGELLVTQMDAQTGKALMTGGLALVDGELALIKGVQAMDSEMPEEDVSEIQVTDAEGQWYMVGALQVRAPEGTVTERELFENENMSGHDRLSIRIEHPDSAWNSMSLTLQCIDVGATEEAYADILKEGQSFNAWYISQDGVAENIIETWSYQRLSDVKKISSALTPVGNELEAVDVTFSGKSLGEESGIDLTFRVMQFYHEGCEYLVTAYLRDDTAKEEKSMLEEALNSLRLS